MAKLPDYIVDELVRLANTEAPKEICGFILQNDGDAFILPCENIAKNPVHNFEIHPRDMALVFENEESIIGVYHSHPRGPNGPSESDRKYPPPPGIGYFIVTLTHVFEYDMETA